MTPNDPPPTRITLLWCPACGRDDRLTMLRARSPHRTPKGKPCDGKPVRLYYDRPQDHPADVDVVPGALAQRFKDERNIARTERDALQAEVERKQEALDAHHARYERWRARVEELEQALRDPR